VPGGLGLKHGQLGALQRVITLLQCVAAKQGDPDTGCGVVGAAVEGEIRNKSTEDLVAHGFGLSGRVHIVFAKVFEHHHKLIGAKSRHRVTLANAAFQALRHLMQQPVALKVPECVVKRLEIVQVDK